MITINMLSTADNVPGQGVGSAYEEQVALVKKCKKFKVRINDPRDADIIHCHTVDLWNYFRMVNTKGTSVCYVHFLPDTLDGSIVLPGVAFSVFKEYVTIFYNSADHLVVVNPTFIEKLTEFGIDRDKITYIPNYVSKDTFYEEPKEKILKTRNEYGIKEDAFVVLGVGQVQTRKGVLDFIDVAKRNKDVTFVWCGGFSFGKITDGYDELKEVCENPPENVKFVGIIDRSKMNDMYNMADMLFMPSYNELFPMSILEAVNSHKPILLRDLDLYKDILFGKYLKGNNNDDFSFYINKLKTDKKLYKHCQEDSQAISEFYSKEHVLNMWIDFYTSIVKEKPKKKTVLTTNITDLIYTDTIFDPESNAQKKLIDAKRKRRKKRAAEIKKRHKKLAAETKKLKKLREKKKKDNDKLFYPFNIDK